ncbi:hypothetical protein P879_03540 [Paragonimus westermani]|uniref:Uncharacterized protein n=1 Tax=Paragonimus westermani TaxID=34504 RepID=A0A8T0DM74_9TREM|nr:hypothetical protein P879_03540 [Paragonimus westermani]
MLEQFESSSDSSLIDKCDSRPPNNSVSQIDKQTKGRKRRRTKKSAFHESVTVSPEDSFAKTMPNKPRVQYSRVLFDENGNLLSAISMCPNLKDTSNRKSKKRAGCFDMKHLSIVADSGHEAYGFVPDISSASSEEQIILPHCPEVLVQHVKDHNLEVNVYKFPHDYASVVKYWYFNLDQLNRLEQSISQQTMACLDDYVPTDAIDSNQCNVDQFCLSSPPPEHSPSGPMTPASNSNSAAASPKMNSPLGAEIGNDSAEQIPKESSTPVPDPKGDPDD